MTASVVIVTKNRSEELRKALASTVLQSGLDEILVLDDGSTDGTAAMVRSEFPAATLKTFPESQGYIIRRNQGAQLARGEILFSLDDDAEFSSPRVVEQSMGDFDHPAIAAVAIPFQEPRKSTSLRQVAPDKASRWVTETFAGTAHALRREAFLNLGGYRPLVHQGEESDFSVRLLEAGHVVRLGRSDPILHWESPKRDWRRMDFYGPRNAILFHAQNTPLGWLPAALCATTVNCLRLTSAPGRLAVRIRGLCTGYGEAFKVPRRPVGAKTYKLWRTLRKRGPLLLQDALEQRR